MISYYVLSKEADQDIEGIYDYTESEHGQNQAIYYLSQIDKLLNLLVQYPESGKSRNEIKLGLRSFSIGSHVVFYRIMKDHIRIVRVLHGSSDIPRFFED